MQAETAHGCSCRMRSSSTEKELRPRLHHSSVSLPYCVRGLTEQRCLLADRAKVSRIVGCSSCFASLRIVPIWYGSLPLFVSFFLLPCSSLPASFSFCMALWPHFVWIFAFSSLLNPFQFCRKAIRRYACCQASCLASSYLVWIFAHSGIDLSRCLPFPFPFCMNLALPCCLSGYRAVCIRVSCLFVPLLYRSSCHFCSNLVSPRTSFPSQSPFRMALRPHFVWSLLPPVRLLGYHAVCCQISSHIVPISYGSSSHFCSDLWCVSCSILVPSSFCMALRPHYVWGLPLQWHLLGSHAACCLIPFRIVPLLYGPLPVQCGSLSGFFPFHSHFVWVFAHFCIDLFPALQCPS